MVSNAAGTWPAALRCRRWRWLTSEVSGRRFLRLDGPPARPRGSSVAMLFPSDTRPAEVERVARATRLLEAAGLPVPEIYAVDAEERWILQEDLGDLTLAHARERGQPVAAAYSEAVALLDRLPPPPLATSPRPPLDARRLRDELEQFVRAALHLAEGPGASLAAECDALAAACAAAPVVLCHRDYHARNLLLKDGRVRVVDHQDAMPGPAPYDRVSLAYDPYVDLPDAIRDRVAGSGERHAAVAVQRLVKAIGTFADHGGAWRASIGPAARQALRLLDRDGVPRLPVLALSLRMLAAAPAAGLPPTAS